MLQWIPAHGYLVFWALLLVCKNHYPAAANGGKGYEVSFFSLQKAPGASKGKGYQGFWALREFHQPVGPDLEDGPPGWLNSLGASFCGFNASKTRSHSPPPPPPAEINIMIKTGVSPPQAETPK